MNPTLSTKLKNAMSYFYFEMMGIIYKVNYSLFCKDKLVL